LNRGEIRELVFPLTQLAGLQTPSKRLWPRVFDLYASTNVDFVDAYNAALVEQRGESAVMSFDHDFDGLAGLERREPPPVPAGDPGQP
jgi:predicted nucleic-acid-binding protein